MSTFFHQPPTCTPNTLGGSVFAARPEVAHQGMPETFIHEVIRAGISLHFAPVASDAIVFNQRLPKPAFRKRKFPLIPATGRPITQRQIDDALDDE